MTHEDERAITNAVEVGVTRALQKFFIERPAVLTRAQLFEVLFPSRMGVINEDASASS